METKKVLELVKKVPNGRVTTYLEIAKALGNPRMARAVGNSLNKNRDLVKVPCFKVVRSDGSVGGYILGTDEKIRRLESSGVTVKEGRVANLKTVLHRFRIKTTDDWKLPSE